MLMSITLTLIALIEVGGLAAIAFLVLNLENLGSVLLEIKFISYALALLNIPEEYILVLFSGVIVLYSFVTIFISSLSIKRISIFSELMGAKIKTSLLKYYLNLEWLEFSKTESSKKMTRVTRDGDIVADMINFFMQLLNKAILALIITIALFLFNASLTAWLGLILSSAYGIIFVAFKSKTSRNSLKITEYMDVTMGIVINLFGSFKEIIFYNNQEKVLKNFEEVDSALANLKGINMTMAYMPRFYIDSSLLLMLVAASMFVSFSGASAISFFAILSVYGIAALKLLPAFQNIFYFSYEIYSRLPHLNNVTTLLAKNSNEDLPHLPHLNEQLDAFKKNITFNNLSFAYAESQSNYIENLNLEITQGKKIAIIGPTGSGKSTFLDLLLGMLEPDSGNIMMDDVLLGKQNILSYRNNFAYVPQKIFFLEDTLKQNIAFSSDRELDEKEFKHAISSAFLDELIDQLPQGLETNISDSNQKVSGGQKQCIGIARAIYRGGDILILDEATSGMDEVLEKKIYEAAFSSEFQTFICVTHKSSLLHKFDEIIVFNNGRIEASGSYDELKKDNEFFNSMVDLQPY